MALTQAKSDRMILWNPCKAVKKPTSEKRQYVVISIEQYETHDLRHTYASTLEELDVSVKKIPLLMGHASATFTMDTYIRKNEKMMDRIKEKLENRNRAKKSKCSKYVQLTADYEKRLPTNIVGSLNLRWCRRPDSNRHAIADGRF